MNTSTQQVTGAVVPVRLMDLTTSERAVALYASDMPSGRRRHSVEQVSAWIEQGVQRLGREQTARWGAFLYGHRLLELSRSVTDQVQQRHEQKYPQRGRLAVADQNAANNVFWTGLSADARSRNLDAAVDGECACHGTGSIPAFYEEGLGTVDMLCPVHAAVTLRAMRGPLVAA
ncbi:hypothetical protein [Streptomyces sp. NPDC088115]|uniref:hypothetical protein n=1 Tax=Streptomyces sp. NPDC088115 TaxID=3365824 RepID=UPI00382114CA